MTSPRSAPRQIESVAVVGAGTMGWQISALCAASGRAVTLFDADPTAGQRAIDRMRMEIPAAGSKSRLGIAFPASADELVSRVRLASTLSDAVGDTDLVIEAVREEIDIKRDVFRQLDHVAPNAILATNSSSYPSAELVPAVSDPSRLLNLHFFSPIWERPMLEVMGCGHTAHEVIERAAAFGRSLGLVTAVVRGQSKGFIINRVWRAVKRESLRVVDEGHADPEDVDRLWMLFFGTPVGPFGIMDMVGLDVVADIEASYAAVSADPTDSPSATLHHLIAEGKLGEKTNSGFYRHPHPDYSRPDWLRTKDQPVRRAAKPKEKQRHVPRRVLGQAEPVDGA